MSKNQKEVPRAKNTKDFSEKQEGEEILEILDSNFSRNKYQSENMDDTSHCITLLKYSRFIATPFSHIPRATVT